MGERGIDPGRLSRRTGHIEGLGVEKRAFLERGPISFSSNTSGEDGYPGSTWNPYKTMEAARKDWKAHRREIMADYAKQLGRRPWAFWEFDRDMDCPDASEQLLPEGRTRLHRARDCMVRKSAAH
jgi:hypothetical protein